MKPELGRFIQEIRARFGKRTIQPIVTKPNVDVSSVIEDLPEAKELVPPVEIVKEPIEVVTSPAFKPMRLPESAEIPYGFLVVIADDYKGDRENTRRVVEEALGLTDQSSGVIAAESAIEFFNTALRGKQGGQADVALVDHDYSYDNPHRPKWRPEPDEIVRLAKTIGIDFSRSTPVKKQRRDGTIYYAVEGMQGFYYPDSINYSLILRALGFEGSIFVVSSDPPPASLFIKPADRIRKAVLTFYPGSPINGMISKNTFDCGSLAYSTAVTEPGRWNEIRIIGDPLAPLNSLLRGKAI